MRGVAHSSLVVQKRVTDPPWASLLRTDTTNVTLSNASNYPKPNYLEWTYDPLFSQNGIPKIYRITGDPGTTNGPVTWGDPVAFAYFTYNPWNCDETMFLIERSVGGTPGNYVFLDGQTYVPLDPQPYRTGTSLWWHPTQPKTLFWFNNNVFGQTTDVTVGASTNVTHRTFTGYSSLDGSGVEGAPNKLTGDVVGFTATYGGGEVAFAYRISDNTKWNDVAPEPASSIDSAHVSPSGRYLQLRYQTDNLYIYDLLSPGPPTMNLIQTWNSTGGAGNPTHSDVARDALGVEYSVGRMGGYNGYVYKRRYDTGVATSIQTTNDYGCFTSVRSSAYPYWVCEAYDPQDSASHSYRGQVIALNLDGTRHVRICQSGMDGTYTYPREFPTFSPSGTRVAFNSNWFNGSSGPMHIFVADLRTSSSPTTQTMQATVAGAGTLSARARANFVTRSTIAGAGGIAASADFLAPKRHSTLAGVGTLGASATGGVGSWQARATLAAAGASNADASVSSSLPTITVIFTSDLQGGSNMGPYELDNVAAVLANYNPDYVICPGDFSNSSWSGSPGMPDPTFTATNSWWDTFSSKMYVCPGNHDATVDGGTDRTPFYNFFAARYPGGTTQTTCWFSVDIGCWHFISLDVVRSMAVGSAQYNWLQADLAANPNKPICAIWHYPRYSVETSHGGTSSVAPMWDLLYAAKADFTVHGHVHTYERTVPLNNNGVPASDGIVQFTDGTGGDWCYPTAPPNSPDTVAYYIPGTDGGTQSCGYMVFTLGPTNYTWKFVHHNGTEYDAGSRATNHPLP